MSYRFLLDENVEHEIGHRLANYGHNVEHVDFIAELGKGTNDHDIGEYSIEENRIILTYDDDFALKIDENQYRGVLYIPDVTRSVETIADSVHHISKLYPQDELQGFEYVGDEWF